MPSPMNFDTWKSRLRADCARKGEMPAFNNVGELVLKVLWESNLDPTVESMGRRKTFVHEAFTKQAKAG